MGYIGMFYHWVYDLLFPEWFTVGEWPRSNSLTSGLDWRTEKYLSVQKHIIII